MSVDRHKFRVYIPDSDKYAENGTYDLDSDGELFCSFTDYGEHVVEYPKGLIIEQCTGQKDKAGTLIYEGHVCKWFINGHIRVGVIGHSYQSFDLFTDYEPLSGVICWDCLRGEIEIIGNIHQNPELLEGK